MKVRESYIAFDAEYMEDIHKLNRLVFDGSFVTEQVTESLWMENDFSSEQEAVEKIHGFLKQPVGKYGYKSIAGNDCRFILLKRYIVENED